MSAEVDDFLIHYGVKGMKWGKRRGGKSRSELRSLDKASKQRDKEARTNEILDARDRIKSGANKDRYQEAKATYKREKYEIGKREARKAFDKVKDENTKDYMTSQQYANGKEVAKGIAAAAAVSILYSALARA